MGHHIQAFISREELLREITQHYPTAIVIPLSQGFGMLPVTKQWHWYMAVPAMNLTLYWRWPIRANCFFRVIVYPMTIP